MNNLENWYGDIMAYAKDNYENDGWDIFVECMSLDDFHTDYLAGHFVDSKTAFQYYENDCRERSSYRMDIMAEAY